jgi:SWIM zinc finger
VSSPTVPSAPAARPAPPIVRHGKTGPLWSPIGGTWYTLRWMGPQPGYKTAWQIRKQDPERQAVYTVAHAKGEQPRCTCPDHANGHICKHIMALAAHGLVARHRAARPKPAPSKSRALKAHLKNAKLAVAEANALSPEARRHLAAMGPEPAPIRGTDRRAALAELPPAANLDIHAELGIPAKPARAALPEGWQYGGTPLVAPAAPAPAPPAKIVPAAPEGSFTAGFRKAVADHLAVKRGELIECAACRYPFDPEAEGSAASALCGPCLDDAKGGRS